jgi:glycerophosphoryl diester phosphodiesterase
VRRIAHRGRVDEDPENTVESIPAALAQTDGLEVDVRLSADGIPVLMHDATLDRTTDGTGPVDALTADELTQQTVQGRATVPRLSDYLDAAVAHDAPLVILDLKDPTDACLEATVAACEGFPTAWLLLAARTDEALAALRALAPTARLASLGITVGNVDDRVRAAADSYAEVLFIHHGDAAYLDNRAAVEVIRRNGLTPAASTLTDQHTIDLAADDGCALALVDLPATTSPLEPV